jgi:hypothetical protein
VNSKYDLNQILEFLVVMYMQENGNLDIIKMTNDLDINNIFGLN